jgi:D-threo-aldose 1-dehydrogenase
MKRRKIGNTNVHLTDVAFGCSAIGNLYRIVSERDVEDVLGLAWDSGIRYFDTAPHYGRGLSEVRLGRFLKGRERQSYALSTKVGRLLWPGEPLEQADGFIAPLAMTIRYDYSGDGIEAAFEQSCERLGTSYIDILYVHDIGRLTHGASHEMHMADLLGTGIDRLQQLKQAGRIGAFGLGVNENEACLEVMAAAELDVILLAGRLTLLDRSAEEALVARCRKSNTSLVLGGIFNSGILATGPVPGAVFDYKPATPQMLEKALLLQSRAESFGVPLATAALRYAMTHPAVTSVLLGTAQMRSLTRNLDAILAQWPEGGDAIFDPLG